ncbi:MAG TPA: MFS transporter [Pirellulales bacterium]|jgi:MFS family permease|nr:MFS transporter [Pirellulales bacterium]
MTDRSAADPTDRVRASSLSLLFGLFYFVQGISEPTEGLIVQPVQSLLKSWGQNAEQIATFAFLLSLPWSIKPVYGLISDFLPLGGFRRKSYLVVASAATSVSLLCLFARDLPAGAVDTLWLFLVVPTIGVAFSDVVIDALMVETGQPRGLTGRLQAVQWSAIYAASILTGTLGGYLSQNSLQRWGFLLCGGITFGTMWLSLWVIQEPRAIVSREHFSLTMRDLRRAMATPAILAVGIFLFCWNFNPFSLTIRYLYITRTLGLSEQFFGNLKSLEAASAMAGSLLYGIYCRRLSMPILVHVSIVMGIVSVLAHWGLSGANSAAAVMAIYGFAMATGTMVLLDLAARACPAQTAGTVFALLMSLANLSEGLSTALGGWCYETWLDRWGNPLAFNLLVGVGGLFSAACWLVVPLLHRTSADR